LEEALLKIIIALVTYYGKIIYCQKIKLVQIFPGPLLAQQGEEQSGFIDV